MNSSLRRVLDPLIFVAFAAGLMGAASAPSNAVFVTCLNHEAGLCRLVSPTVGLTVTVKNQDAVIQYFAPTNEGFVERAHTQVRADLEARVASGTMGAAEANIIFAEILANPFVAYKLPPNSESLNRDVGFAQNIELSPQDQIEVLRAHVQMSLSVSAVTARYLSDGLGLKVIDTVKTLNPDDPNLVSESESLLTKPSEGSAAEAPTRAPTEKSTLETSAPQAKSVEQSQPQAPAPTPAAPSAADVSSPQSTPVPQPTPEPKQEQLPESLPEPLTTNPPTERIT